VKARSPREIVAAVRREAEVLPGALRAERSLRRAAATGEPLLLGPYLSEIGHELEYWIPFLRRELHRYAIPPEQATVMTRGGAALWYRDFAAHELDALELLTPEQYLPRFEERYARARDLKQLRMESFDRELIRLARGRLGDVTVIHPSLMFTRLRGLWFKNMPLSELWPRVEYRPLELEPMPGLPAGYVAVKAYFNECFEAKPETERFLRELIDRLTAVADVVLLSTGLAVDDHAEWAAKPERVHSIEHLLRPQDNLAVQSRIAAGARALVSTYGGFSYLGPFLGVPTLSFLEVEQTMPVHYEVIRAAFPGADYTRIESGDLGAVDAFAARISLGA
jgi:hypothetical protein